MNLQSFRLIAAPFTPMHPNGQLNLQVVSKQAQHLVASGVDGAFVAGTSGEGQSLTTDERMELADTWARDARRANLKLFIHVGHNCQEDAIRLATHAVAIGADAIAMHAPSWYRQPSVRDLIEFCVPIASAAACLPFYLYDMPKVTGIHVSAAEFLSCAKAEIPGLAGIKYTNPDCITVQECIQVENYDFDVLWGTDETLLAGVALGVSGAVGSTYNFAAPLYRRMLTAIESGDWQLARAAQATAIKMVRLFEQYSPLAALKFAMSAVGVDCGPVRAPVQNLTASDQRRLLADLEQIHFSTEIAVIGHAASQSLKVTVKSA